MQRVSYPVTRDSAGYAAALRCNSSRACSTAVAPTSLKGVATTGNKTSAECRYEQRAVAEQAIWQSVFAIPSNGSQAAMHNWHRHCILSEAPTAPWYACWGARCFTCFCRALSLRSTGGWMLGSIMSSDSLGPRVGRVNSDHRPSVSEAGGEQRFPVARNA
jgi:hypothetical protein